LPLPVPTRPGQASAFSRSNSPSRGMSSPGRRSDCRVSADTR
jgi:hypothetical protein